MQRLKTFLTSEKPAVIPSCRTWLLLGGTGVISSGLTELLRAPHLDAACITRGRHPLPASVESLVCDVNDVQAMAKLLENRRFDVVVDFLTFTPEQARQRVELFQGRCGRYIFISTAMTYQTPPQTLFISEKSPQENPYAPYAQQKILCEAVFRAAHRTGGFPLTIVRPSCTYGDTRVPYVFFPTPASWTLLERLRAGKPLLVPGDGNVFWTITHNSDVARGIVELARCQDALGEDFHLVQDEHMTWDTFAQVIAKEAGAPAPRLIHVSSDMLIRKKPELKADLLGDKAWTKVFDNTKLRSFVPGFRFLTPFREGVRKSIYYLDHHPELQRVDEELNAWMDDMIATFGE